MDERVKRHFRIFKLFVMDEEKFPLQIYSVCYILEEIELKGELCNNIYGTLRIKFVFFLNYRFDT